MDEERSSTDQLVAASRIVRVIFFQSLSFFGRWYGLFLFLTTKIVLYWVRFSFLSVSALRAYC